MENVTYVTDTLNLKINVVIRDKKIRKSQDQKDKGKITKKGEIEIDPENKNTNPYTKRHIRSWGKCSTGINVAHVQYEPYPHVVNGTQLGMIS